MINSVTGCKTSPNNHPAKHLCMSWLWLCSRCTAAEKLQFHSFVLEPSTESLLLQMFWVILSWKPCCEMWEVIAVKKNNTQAFSAALSLREEDSCYCLLHLPFFFHVSNIFCNSATSLWHFTKSSLSVISAPFHHLLQKIEILSQIKSSLGLGLSN